MGNLTYSREYKAERELDKAYERLLASSNLTHEILDELLKSGIKFEEILTEFKTATMTESQRKRLGKILGSTSIATNLISDIQHKKNTNIALFTAALDGGLLALSIINPVAGTILLTLDIANFADKITGGNGRFDIAKKLTNLWESLHNTTSELPDSEMLKKGILQITMHDGTVYARPLIDTGSKFSLFGDSKDDVLFGGNGDDILQGRSGNDLLLGGNGYDTYFTDGKDTIRDEDGKGQVYFHGRKLTDGTQIEKDSNIYKTKDNIKYELIDNKLIVNDSFIIEDFNSYRECLDIALHKADEIAVNVSNVNAVEKAGKMNFTISLSRELKENEFVKVTIPKIGNNEAKTYMFLHGSSTDWKVGDGVEYIFESSANYEYTWSDDSLVEPDETISIKATIVDVSDGLIAKDGKIGIGTIQDDDDDPDNPNDTFPDTDPASNKTSPIVIDLNNDGVKTISRKNNKIYFDLDNNKFAQNTSWIDSNDGILINKSLITDNNITNGSQLFGNYTLLTNGNLATNGFEALKEFDENNDGVINKLDQNAYENLAIWQDVNSNAKLDVNELKSLKELGIKEINLNYTNSNFIDENGNEHRQTSSIVFENGNKASISDVWLDTLNADTKYVGEKISLSNE
ncbi:hypothetical protein, partial [Campylobacter ureolyticus]|uniref:hypothetical protein n=1 Tax=Campylobacter ureolyticus TaxID=827 RepID=UPI002907A9A5